MDSLSLIVTALPAATFLEPLAITTNVRVLPLRSLSVIASVAASFERTLITSRLAVSAFWSFFTVRLSFGAVLSVDAELAGSSSAMFSAAVAWLPSAVPPPGFDSVRLSERPPWWTLSSLTGTWNVFDASPEPNVSVPCVSV